ncbi:scarecrow-like protein 9 [Salvia miltiorrhiza]|uniref:scarecrow-like protein 9 n=1 Tax=Salvia miltiorrhiza TaxID=226208 RepID=UPI0025AD1FAD|nr:scarecrow-like protein 9 [Salvia miltiorrhiza]XP_057801351.1 scarecrow-like protein 9 [Salvia miltiorrhiza]
MDPRFHRIFNGVGLGNQSIAGYANGRIGNGARFGISYPDPELVNEHRNEGSSFQEHCVGGVHLVLDQPFSNRNGEGPVSSSLVDIDDDCDFSDAVLRYIDQILMEEDMEDKSHMLQESLDLQAKERSFYEVLGKKYPPSPLQESGAVSRECGDDSNPNVSCFNSKTSSSDGSGYLIDIVDPSWMIKTHTDHDASISDRAKSSICSSSNSLNNLFVDGWFSDSPVSPLQVRDIYNESQLVWNFKRGVDEASRFLPAGKNLLVNAGVNTLATKDTREGEIESRSIAERQLPSGSRGKKSRSTVDVDLEEERSSKLPAVYAESDSDVPVDEFDDVLLSTMGDRGEKFAAYREVLQNASSKGSQQNGQTKRASGGRGRAKKQNKKKEVIDLRTLLINCAQAVAADDRRSASELLKQIRQHASPYGEGNQRLAHYFADGLEARMAGTGSQIHKAFVNKKTSAADYLKAYYTYLASSPFKKISNFTSNKTIMFTSIKAARVHVIDFGILYGFQWPTLIQRIAERDGGPPMLRITGIDFPQPGFRPAEKIEETGRRLARYAKQFKVPFEYNAIAKKWENIKIEDLKIEKGEFLIVNSMYRAKNLLDETVLAESSRTMVLNLIRKVNPDLFIHGIVNGAYSAPFFVTRFREVLFHFSALFDMLETNVPRDQPERMLIERDIFGSEALNVIACEGWERVERPETYKQWQVRHLRAGFAQVPLNQWIMERAIYKVRTHYHKDFVIDEDSQWMLMGWKGRIIYAISCWKPV